MLTSPSVPRASVVPALGPPKDAVTGTGSGALHGTSHLKLSKLWASGHGMPRGLGHKLRSLLRDRGQCPAQPQPLVFFWPGAPPRAPKQQLLGLGWLPTWGSFPLQCSLVIAFHQLFQGSFLALYLNQYCN